MLHVFLQKILGSQRSVPKKERLSWIRPFDTGSWLFVGIDPSLSSSGWCVLPVVNGAPLALMAGKIETQPGDPSPKRMNEILTVLNEHVEAGVFKIMEKRGVLLSDLNDINLVVTFEEPPPTASSSGWLFALNQMLWLHFMPNNPISRYFNNVTLWCINSTQVKSLYYNLPSKPPEVTYPDLKSRKSAVVATVKACISNDSRFQDLVASRKFSHDVLEAIFFATQGANLHTQGKLFPSTYTPKIWEFVLNDVPNSKGEDRSWLMRPLEFFFHWSQDDTRH